MVIDFGFFEIILVVSYGHGEVGNEIALLEEKSHTISSELSAIVDKQRLVDTSLGQRLVASSFSFERFSEQRIVRGFR